MNDHTEYRASGTYEHGNAVVVVYRPAYLDEEERRRRENAAVNAMAIMGRELMKAKAEGKERRWNP